MPIVLQTVSLSLVAADWFFVEFADGATQFVMPPQWHPTINKHASLGVRKPGPTMVTSFASTPSSTPSVSRAAPLPHASRFGSHGSLSPISPHSPGPVLGHTPHQAQTSYQTQTTYQPQTPYQTQIPYQAQPTYTPNPYVQPYAGVPQFVPQPPPPPLQQQQQQVHVTNVYNTIQQQPQKPANGTSGTVQLLGGALKVAGAVLPLIIGGNNNGGGGGGLSGLF